MERLNPLNDYLFLKVMGEKGAEEQCLAFLNAVFEDTALLSRQRARKGALSTYRASMKRGRVTPRPKS
ncbi:MAG: hypothetical protein LBD22_07205 [Spirochaetaceae bacterium]|jgi:hypothetical protein|nr:hypothetical protein [Spirochaetaceae bacterium]